MEESCFLHLQPQGWVGMTVGIDNHLRGWWGSSGPNYSHIGTGIICSVLHFFTCITCPALVGQYGKCIAKCALILISFVRVFKQMAL